jgi:nucleotide-binding universal stress UspA family protein
MALNFRAPGTTRECDQSAQRGVLHREIGLFKRHFRGPDANSRGTVDATLSCTMKTNHEDFEAREFAARAPTLPEIDATLHPATAARVSRILVPTDFSDASDHAFGYATALAAQLGASLIVCHVYQLPTPLAGAELSTLPSVLSTAAIDHAARIGIQQAIARHAKLEVPVAAVVRPGDPELEIRAIAREVGADLIILGTHGRTGLMRALVGSVTDDVVHHSEIPVLVLHGEGKKA